MPSNPRNPAMQSHLETQVNFMTELTRKSYDSVRKLSELNLHLAQQLMEDSANASRQLMSCSDPFQLSSTAFTQLQPVTEHLRNYQRQLMGVLAGAQVELTRTAETHIPDASRSAAAAAEEIARRTADATQVFTRQRSGDGAAQSYGSNGAHNTPG